MNLNLQTGTIIDNPIADMRLENLSDEFAVEAWQLDLSKMATSWGKLSKQITSALTNLNTGESEFSARGSKKIHINAVKVSRKSYEEIREIIIPVPEGMTAPYLWCDTAIKGFETLNILDSLESASVSLRKIMVLLSANDPTVENLVKESLLNGLRIKKTMYAIPIVKDESTNVERSFGDQFKTSREVLEVYATLKKLDHQLTISKNVQRAVVGIGTDIEAILKLIDPNSGSLDIELSSKFRKTFADYLLSVADTVTHYGHILLTIMACQHNFALSMEAAR